MCWEDPLEKRMATHSSILAWEISCTEDPGGLQSHGSEKVRHDLMTKQQNISFPVAWLINIESRKHDISSV